MKRLIVRADDLGFSEGVNYGIAKSVKEGIIKSVGLMTNMPAAVHGYNLLRGEQVCYGQHTNICVGKPITDPALIPSITNEQGEFKSSAEYRSTKEDFVVLDEVILEIEAQYQRFKEITGREPSYFEGHAVASANFFKGLAIVAERHGLRNLPMSFIGDSVIFAGTKVYNFIESMDAGYDPKESIKRIAQYELHEDGVNTFICHPGYLDAYILEKSSLTIPRPLEVEMACDPEIKKWLAEHDVELITYDDI